MYLLLLLLLIHEFLIVTTTMTISRIQIIYVYPELNQHNISPQRQSSPVSVYRGGLFEQPASHCAPSQWHPIVGQCIFCEFCRFLSSKSKAAASISYSDQRVWERERHGKLLCKSHRIISRSSSSCQSMADISQLVWWQMLGMDVTNEGDMVVFFNCILIITPFNIGNKIYCLKIHTLNLLL